MTCLLPSSPRMSTEIDSNPFHLGLWCHDYLWTCSHVCVCVLVSQSCLILCDAMDCSPPGSSVNDILQSIILERVAILFSRDVSTYTHVKMYLEYIPGVELLNHRKCAFFTRPRYGRLFLQNAHWWWRRVCSSFPTSLSTLDRIHISDFCQP